MSNGDWSNLPQQTADGCPLALATVSNQVLAINRRSSPEINPGNVVGGWPGGARVMVWSWEVASDPPGEWLLCQGVSGDVTLTWAHGVNLVRG